MLHIVIATLVSSQGQMNTVTARCINPYPVESLSLRCVAYEQPSPSPSHFAVNSQGRHHEEKTRRTECFGVELYNLLLPTERIVIIKIQITAMRGSMQPVASDVIKLLKIATLS